VHATEPEVRERLLVNERAGLIMDQLRDLIEGGLEVHTQVVLCPGWNDEEHLNRTIDDLWGLGPSVRSLSVVPVGLTRHNVDRPVRLLRASEAEAAIAQVDQARRLGEQGRGFGWCYAADEMYLIAGLPLPEASYYDDGALYENGVGAIRRFIDGFERGLAEVPRFEGRRIRLVTGGSMRPFLDERASALAVATEASVEVVHVENRYFGDTVTIAGLLGGRDIIDALQNTESGDLVVLPAEALNADDVFIDDVSMDDVRKALAPASIYTGYEVTEALRSV